MVPFIYLTQADIDTPNAPTYNLSMNHAKT
jgi:hypothetical protein